MGEVQNCLVFERKNRDYKKIEIKGEIMVDELTRNYEKREWTIRHIPVRVKGRSPRPYRIPRLWVSIMMGVCLYLAVHLNGNKSLQSDRVYLRRAERDLSSSFDYYNPYNNAEQNSTFFRVSGMRPIAGAGNVVQMER